MGILTRPTDATNRLADVSLIHVVRRFEIACLPGAAWFRHAWQRLKRRTAGSQGRGNDQRDAHFGQLLRLEMLAARHPAHSLEILRKRAACGKARP